MGETVQVMTEEVVVVLVDLLPLQHVVSLILRCTVLTTKVELIGYGTTLKIN